MTAVSTQSDRVNTSITSLEAALKDLKEGDDARQKQFGEVKDEVDALKELVPKVSECIWNGKRKKIFTDDCIDDGSE